MAKAHSVCWLPCMLVSSSLPPSFLLPPPSSLPPFLSPLLPSFLPYENESASRSVASDSLGHPMDCSPPGSSVHGVHQARILERVAVPFSRGSSPPRDQPQVSCVAGRFCHLSHQGSHLLSSSLLLIYFSWFPAALISLLLLIMYVCISHL